MTRNSHTGQSTSTAKRHPSPTTHASASTPDALSFLSEDHKMVKSLFEKFETIKRAEEADNEGKRNIVEEACAALKLHTQLEEEIFYPAMREALNDNDILDEAIVEHATAKQLISQLARMEPGEQLYDATFTVLGEYVKHHIEEEEKEMFKKARQSHADLAEIGEMLQQRKTQVQEREEHRKGTDRHKKSERSKQVH